MWYLATRRHPAVLHVWIVTGRHSLLLLLLMLLLLLLRTSRIGAGGPRFLGSTDILLLATRYIDVWLCLESMRLVLSLRSLPLLSIFMFLLVLMLL